MREVSRRHETFSAVVVQGIILDKSWVISLDCKRMFAVKIFNNLWKTREGF